MSKTKTDACNLVNLMISKAKSHQGGMLFFKTEVNPGWNLCMDFCNSLQWPDNEIKLFIEKEFSMKDNNREIVENKVPITEPTDDISSEIVAKIEDGLHYAQIGVYATEEAEIVDPCISVGIMMNNGNCVGVEPFYYESYTIYSSQVIDYDDNVYINGVFGKTNGVIKGELRKRFNNFVMNKFYLIFFHLLY